MADIDWSNIPREVVALDTLGQVDTTNTTDWDWYRDKQIEVLDPLGQVDILPNAYPYVTTIVPYQDLDILESGTPGYPGLALGTEIVPLEFQPLPELNAITSFSSIQIVLLEGSDVPIEYWG